MSVIKRKTPEVGQKHTNLKAIFSSRFGQTQHLRPRTTEVAWFIVNISTRWQTQHNTVANGHLQHELVTRIFSVSYSGVFDIQVTILAMQLNLVVFILMSLKAATELSHKSDSCQEMYFK